ncbi:MAG: SPOR domain-containing protein [Phycisphaerales bacterium]
MAISTPTDWTSGDSTSSLPRTREHARRMAGALAMVVLTLLTACASNRSGGDTSASATDYMLLYQTGQYSTAYDSASSAARALGTSSQSREQASMIAGLSAQALGRADDSRQWLKPLQTSPRPEVKGKALAALGLISQSKGEHATAANDLRDASTWLESAGLVSEAARSAMYASDSYSSNREEAAAQRELERASILASKLPAYDGQAATLRAMIADRQSGRTVTAPWDSKPTRTVQARQTQNTAPTGSVFTVQVNAFSDQNRAQQSAARMARYAPARVVPILNAEGKTLYAVRLGQFATKAEADSLKRTIGGGARVVVASATP